MTAAELVCELESLGTEGYKRVLLRHGVKEPVFGVKVEELKKYQRRIKRDYRLSLQLYDTGVYDAQYLAGLIADPPGMTKKDLKHWLATGNSAVLCGNVVAAVAAECPHGRALALEWIDSKRENAAQTGWTTLGFLVSVTSDADLDLAELERLLLRAEQTIHGQPDRVRYAMNGFVISLGSYVAGLTASAIDAGERIGRVSVDMGETACQVPFAPDYIRKVESRGTVGKKRKTAMC